MASKKSTRRALLLSVLSLLLCISMLVGTTFAWFTDSVTSGVNKIMSGNLDVELEYYVDGAWKKVTEQTNVFKVDTQWEPGHTEVVYLKASNAGSLALNYKLGVAVAEETKSTNVYNEELQLSKYIKMGAIEGVSAPYADRAAARAALTGEVKTLADGGYNAEGTLYAANDVPAGGKTETYVALVVYMPEETGNEANFKTGAVAPSILLGINLFATQETYEKDSFDNQYDKDAADTLAGYGAAGLNLSGATYIPINNVAGTHKLGSLNIPADAVAAGVTHVTSTYTEVTDHPGVTVNTGEKAITYDITVNGLKAGNTTPITVDMYIGSNMTVQSVYHDGVAITDYTYRADTGYVTFKTTSFSPFTAVFVEGVQDENLSDTELPHAIVTDADNWENTAIDWESYSGFCPSDFEQQLDAAYVFKAPHTADTVKDSVYKDWYCDYYVKLEQDGKTADDMIPEGALFLGGNYGDFGWVGFENPAEVPYATPIPLIGSFAGQWTYESVVTWVGEFTCGVARAKGYEDLTALNGAKFTVMLRLINPENTEEYYDVNTITYTFPTVVTTAQEIQDAFNSDGDASIVLGGDIDLNDLSSLFP